MGEGSVGAEAARKPFDPAAIAADLRETNAGTLAVIRGIHTATRTWVLGSVVAFNAGGIVAALTIIEKADDDGWSAIMFGCALIACFLTGLAWMFAHAKIAKRFVNFHKLLEKPSLEVFTSSTYTSTVESFKDYKREYAPAYVFGAIAMCLTIYATISFVRALPTPSEAEVRRCTLIEQEMMRPKPRRGDLPDMFQAFGCQSRTERMPQWPVT